MWQENNRAEEWEGKKKNKTHHSPRQGTILQCSSIKQSNETQSMRQEHSCATRPHILPFSQRSQQERLRRTGAGSESTFQSVDNVNTTFSMHIRWASLYPQLCISFQNSLNINGAPAKNGNGAPPPRLLSRLFQLEIKKSPRTSVALSRMFTVELRESRGNQSSGCGAWHAAVKNKSSLTRRHWKKSATFRGGRRRARKGPLTTMFRSDLLPWQKMLLPICLLLRAHVQVVYVCLCLC